VQLEPRVDLHYMIGGSAPLSPRPRRAVLYVHGGPCVAPRDRIPALERLPLPVIYYHQRGCGLSTRVISNFPLPDVSHAHSNMQQLVDAYGLAELVADIERVRRIVGAEQLVLVGHSFGGFIASLYASEFPERTEAMVLVVPAAVVQLPTKHDLFSVVSKNLEPAARRKFVTFMNTFMDFSPSVFRRTEDEMVGINSEFGRWVTQALPAAFPAETVGLGYPSGGWAVQGCFLSMGARHDYRDALRKATAPTLVLHGEADFLPVDASADHYANVLPRATLQKVPGNHMLHLDAASGFGAVVTRFLESKKVM
jgi:proline iminopeptidase